MTRFNECGSAVCLGGGRPRARNSGMEELCLSIHGRRGHAQCMRAPESEGEGTESEIERAEGEYKWRGMCLGSPHRCRGAGMRGSKVGHLLPCMEDASAFRRARGERRSGQGGSQFWASYRPIWTLDPKAKLKPMNCSTSFIMGAESLEK